MRKPRKILSMLLVACMLVMLLPVGVLAASNTDPVSDPEGAYTLNIVNDSDVLMLFKVTRNGNTESYTVGASETLPIGINEGDRFTVEKVGNSNYKVLSESASFQSGDYENVIAKEFSHKVGAGFKTGEQHIYVQKDGSTYEGEVATINGTLAVKGSKIDCPAKIKSNTSSGATIGITVNGTEKTTTVSGNFASSNTNSSTAQSNGTKLTNGMNEFFQTIVSDIPGYDAERYDIINGKITGKTVSSGGCNPTTTTEYTVDSSPAVYIPLEDQIIDIVDEVELGDITLTYTTEVEAKVGSVEFNVLNGERLDDLHSKMTINTVTSLMGMLSGGAASEGTGMSMDGLAGLLSNPDLMSLIAIEALDNMPKGYTAVLKEVDKGDGLYEGLVYEIPMTETMFINIDMDVMMQDALGSTLFNIAKGQMPAEMLEMEILLPVSIGQSFALQDIRMGQYTLTIESPGEGWYPAAENTFNVNITDGGKVSGLGGNHVYGSIRTRDLIDPLTSAMGMDLGCLGSLAGLMLGSNTVKFVNTNGVVFNHKLNHIEFTNATLEVDEAGQVKTTGIPGATFMLVDRDRMNALIDSLLGMGSAVVNSVVGGIRFDELLGFQQQINDTEEEGEEIEADPGMIERILVSVLALGDRLDGFNVPAILESVADENGLVTFGPENNVTMQKLLDLIPVLADAAQGIGSIIPGSGGSSDPAEPGEGEGGEGGEGGGSSSGSGGLVDLSGLDMGTILQLLNALGDPDQISAFGGMLQSLSGMGSGSGDSGEEPAEPSEPSEPSDPSEDPEEPAEEGTDPMTVIMNLLQEFGGGDLGTAMLNFLGVSEGRFPTGNYILIQEKVPEGRVRNPMMYVFENEWNAEEREYHTYASVDLAGVMSNEQMTIFGEQLSQSYEQLSAIFGETAGAADNGLDLFRQLLGEGDSYDSTVLFDTWDALVAQITAQIEAARAAAEASEEPGEDPEPVDPAEDPAPGDDTEPSDDADPVEPLDPENPSASVSESVRAGLVDLVNQVLNTYIPKATVLSYFTNLIYRNTGNFFESQEEVAALISALATDEEYTFTDFNNKIKSMLEDANFVLNGEVNRNWYYYDVSPNIFTNVNVAYHYILNQLLPPELASVIERAIQGYVDDGEALVDEIIESIANDGQEPDTPETPDEPDAPDLPGTPDDPGSGSGNSGSGLIGGIGDFIRGIIGIFKRW